MSLCLLILVIGIADKDLVVNVAISKTSDAEKQSVLLQGCRQKQEQILQQLGVNNPLVSLQQYSNTLSKLIEQAGFKDTQSFINSEVPTYTATTTTTNSARYVGTS